MTVLPARSPAYSTQYPPQPKETTMPNAHPNPMFIIPAQHITPAATVLVDATAYEVAHGKKPAGRGAWIFGISRSAPRHLTLNIDAPYSEAVIAARRWAARMNLISVYLLP